MKTREIGNDTVGRERVGAIGLGLMTFDQTGAQPREQLAATVRAAVDAGVRLFDTADAYGPGDDLGAEAQGANERLIAGLLDELGLRSEVLLATKGGHTRTEGGGWALDSSPEHLRAAVDASLQRLGVDQLALWQHHRPDPNRDYADILGTLKEIGYDGSLTVEFVAPLDRTPANPYKNAMAAADESLTAEQLKFIEDHGSGVLSEEFYSWLVEESVKTLRANM